MRGRLGDVAVDTGSRRLIFGGLEFRSLGLFPVLVNIIRCFVARGRRGFAHGCRLNLLALEKVHWKFDLYSRLERCYLLQENP